MSDLRASEVNDWGKTTPISPNVQGILLIYTRAVVIEFNKSTEQVTSQILTAFLGYCGEIERLIIQHAEKNAIVLFQEEASAQTALLLNNGTVCGGPVTVRAIDDKLDVALVKKLHVVCNDGLLKTKVEETDKMDTTKAVFVSNLSEKTDSANLQDFFSFCGEVERIKMYQDPSNAPLFVAIVVFKDEEALGTALLLEGAKIHDIAITVAKYTNQTEVNHEFKLVDDKKGDADSKVEPSATGRIAAMKAAGYDVGKRSIARAAAFDEKYGVRSKASSAASAASTAASTGLQMGKNAFKAGVGLFRKKK